MKQLQMQSFLSSSHIIHAFYEHLVGLVSFILGSFVEMPITNQPKWCFNSNERQRDSRKSIPLLITMQLLWFIPTTVNELGNKEKKCAYYARCAIKRAVHKFKTVWNHWWEKLFNQPEMCNFSFQGTTKSIFSWAYRTDQRLLFL